MIAVFLKLNNSSEDQAVRRLCSDITALRGEERLKISTYDDLSTGNVPASEECFDLIIYHVGCEKDISHLHYLRKRSPDARILILANRELPPDRYVTSDVLPTELILLPAGPGRISKTLKKLINGIYEDQFEGLHTLRFSVRRGDDTIYIPTREICYFEASNKKILLKSTKREILFWGFLKEIQERLPPCFARCHRSIIINTLRIESINWTEGTIIMEDQTTIPFSRKYKKNLERSLNLFAA